MLENNSQNKNVARFILELSGKRGILILISVVVFISILDLIGIAIIFPYIKIVANPKLLTENTFPLFHWMRTFDEIHLILIVSGILIFLFLCKVAIQGFLIRFQHRHYASFTAKITDNTVNKILSARYGLFQEIAGSELASIAYSNTVHASLAFRAIIQIFNEICFLSFLAITFFIISPLATLAALIVLCLVALILYFFVIHPSTLLGKEQSSIENSRYRLLFSIVNSIRDIKVMGLSKLFGTKNHEVSAKYASIAWRYNFNSELPKLLIETVALTGLVATSLIVILVGASSDELIPVIGVVAVASIRTIPAFTRLMAGFSSYRFSRTFVERLIYIHDRLTSLKHERTEDVLTFDNRIELQGIDFCYKDKVILDNINIEIKKGQFIGIVGNSGAGKTTLLDIITGLQPASRGTFLCDGKSFNPFDSTSMEKIIGYVPQVLSLLDDSISYNISFDHKPDMQQLMRAINMANLNSLINDLPQGIDTWVGENGINLSGGQRQRIGIARALYRQPNIIVFDEATSALDAHTEQEISSEIDKLRGEVTVLMVSHRLATVVNCDQIYVLSHGKIGDSGTHDELLDKCEMYKDLYALQTTFA